VGKVESFRRVPHRPGTGNGSAKAEVDASALRSRDVPDDETAEPVDGDALLALLAAGDPPAFATDSRDRIVFWNRGMADLVGRMSQSTLGHRCYETLGGRDIFGNRFCYPNCPVIATLREGDPVRGFELKVATGGRERRAVGLTILKIPGARPDLFTLVHIVQPIARESRLAEFLAGPEGKSFDRQERASTDGNPKCGAPPLTARETEVLGHVVAGLQNKEVAQTLGLSVATVRNHVHSILDKLGVHSKLEAVSLSFRNGWNDALVRASAPPAFFTDKS
jgi:DNA-binding CsgD family transcriptional regulator/PAS domain-containing protein